VVIRLCQEIFEISFALTAVWAARQFYELCVLAELESEPWLHRCPSDAFELALQDPLASNSRHQLLNLFTALSLPAQPEGSQASGA
jgi:hypothetical protein